MALDIRNELARDIAFNNVEPYAFGLPVLAFLLVLAIRRGLAPLRRMEIELRRRSPERLDPLTADDNPSEMQPLILTMNQLFGRVVRTLDNERRFTSDAAHELRTPLAALRVQLQVAQRATDETERQAAVAKALRGAERMTHLVGQLLALARLDEPGESGRNEELDLSALLQDVVREIAPVVAEKGFHLEHMIEPEVTIVGNPNLLGILIRNLLDNALRYGVTGGRISILLAREEDHIALRVADDGPGVGEKDRERLGARFQRFSPHVAEGVGLGLSIVRRVAELHGAKVDFGQGLAGKGLGITLRFPISA